MNRERRGRGKEGERKKKERKKEEMKEGKREGRKGGREGESRYNDQSYSIIW